MSSKYSTYTSKRASAARKTVEAMLPAPCYRCGRVVTKDMKWEADHPISRVVADQLGISAEDQDRSVLPAHASCNHKAGAVLSNQRKAAVKAESKIIQRVERPQLSFSEDLTNTPAAAPQNLSLEASEGTPDDV